MLKSTSRPRASAPLTAGFRASLLAAPLCISVVVLALAAGCTSQTEPTIPHSAPPPPAAIPSSRPVTPSPAAAPAPRPAPVTGIATLPRSPAPARVSPSARSTVAVDDDHYIVLRGDTGTKIAHAHQMPVSDLVALNPGIDWARLRVGQVIRIRRTSTSPITNSASAQHSPID